MATKQKIPIGKSSAKQKAASPSKMRMIADFFDRNKFAVALFLLVFIVFGNGIFNEYGLDDEFYTNGANKSTLKGFKGIPEIFTSRTFYNNDGSGYSYRPITVSSFAIEIQFFGENPHVSHFINVLLYAFVLILLFNLLRKWFTTQGDWFSFFVTLIFLVHPLHTEVVDNIKCRDELLAVFFTLCSIHVLWKFRETGNKLLIAVYPLLFLVGALSKTTVLPFYFLIPLALWFFTNDGWKKIALYMVPLLLVGVVTKIAISHGLPPESRTYKDFENPLWGHISFLNHTATSFYIIGRYFLLHIFPYPLVYYYGYKYVDIVSWSNPIAIISLAGHLALGIFALRELKKKSILGFGILFYLINIAIFSNLLKPAPGLMAERFVFSASLGFCIVVVSIIFRLLKKDPAAFRWQLDDYKLSRNILMGIILIFALRSVVRNEDWVSKETLYGNDMKFLNSSAKANMLWAAWLSKNAMQANSTGDTAGARSIFEQSRIYYKQAADVAPYYHTAWSNYGTTFFFTAHYRQALPYFWKAVQLDSTYYDGWFNVGMAYDKLGMADSAIYGLSQSIHYDSTYVQAYENLVRVLMQKNKDPQEALTLLRKAVKHKPDSEIPWNDMEKIYVDKLKDTASAASSMEMAAKIDPTNIPRLFNLSDYYAGHNDAVKASRYSQMAGDELIKLEKHKTDPKNIQRLYSVGQYFMQRGNRVKGQQYMQWAQEAKNMMDEDAEKTFGDSIEFPFIALLFFIVFVWRQRIN